MDTQEQFKPFPLNPLVMVGDLGTIIRPNGKTAKQTPMNIGYLNTGIMVNGIVRVMKVHRVIALTWLDNPLRKPSVNHINGIKTDNRLVNLEWATMKEQHEHAINNGLKTYSGGRKAGFKMSEETKAKMKEKALLRWQNSEQTGYKGRWTAKSID